MGALVGVTLLGALACSSPERQPSGYVGADTGGRSSTGASPGQTVSGGAFGAGAGGHPGLGGRGDTNDPVPPGSSCGGVVCSPFAVCADEAESRCECAEGLEGDGLRCKDVNECLEASELCGEQASCENTFGSYDCRCEAGYRWDGAACADIEECAGEPCDPAASCTESAPGFSCTCGEDLAGDGFFCRSDACGAEPCGPNGTCITTADDAPGYVCRCDQGFAGRDGCSPCGDQLLLLDAALRGAVNVQLGRDASDDEDIPLSALAGQTSLGAVGFDVTDLSGLSCWPSLARLDLSDNPRLLAENAAALAELTHLTDLRLDCTGIDDLGVLAHHPSLRTLSVNASSCAEPTQLVDASATGRISGLEVLDLRGQALDSVEFLSGSRGLQALRLGHNRLEAPAELANLTLLRELDLSANNLRILEGIEGLSQLDTLVVADNQLESLEPTVALSSLRTLIASGNAIESLPDWRKLRGLRDLTLDFNRIDSIAPVVPLDQVSWVSLTGNVLSTLSPLSDGSFRGTLVIAGNPLLCESEAGNIAALRARGIDVIGDCSP